MISLRALTLSTIMGIITLVSTNVYALDNGDLEVIKSARELLAACNKQAEDCFNSGRDPQACVDEHAACVAKIRLPSPR